MFAVECSPERMNEHSQAYAWFETFCARLHGVLASGAVAHLHPVGISIERLSLGWCAPVACLDGEQYPAFQVWLDNYLDQAGSYHLGCWYQTNPRAARAMAQELASAWGVKNVPIHGRADRDSANEWLSAEVGRREMSRIGEPMIDLWTEAYAGLYAAAAPVVSSSLESVVDAAIDAMRRLSEVVRAPRGQAAARSVDLDELNGERWRRLVHILARPEQQRLRQQALDVHGACVITGETVPSVLEAAHIRPVHAGGADSIDNILLLRADLHRLFDAGLLTIRQGPPPCVQIARGLVRPGTSYALLATLIGGGKRITTRQWLALETRNHAWDQDRGLSAGAGWKARSPLLVPSRP